MPLPEKARKFTGNLWPGDEWCCAIRVVGTQVNEDAERSLFSIGDGSSTWIPSATNRIEFTTIQCDYRKTP
ncbi:MAG: hypothetical protein NVSMB44_36080 [Ktedonobacteraceae bacterium]